MSDGKPALWLDWLQRLQSLWSAIPQPVRTLIVAGITAIGTYVSGLRSNLLPIQVWGLVVGMTLAASLLYAAIVWAHADAAEKRARTSQTQPSHNRDDEGPSASAEIVRERDFVNETVDADGKLFHDCRFENVTLYYDGKRATGFTGVKFLGTLKIRTRNASAASYARFLDQFRKMGEAGLVSSIELQNHPPDGRVKVLAKEVFVKVENDDAEHIGPGIDGPSIEQKRRFTEAVKGVLEDSNVTIAFAHAPQRAIAESLASMFQSAGWRTKIEPVPLDTYRFDNRYFTGVKLQAANEHLVEVVTFALKSELGVHAVESAIKANQFPRDNPKWATTQAIIRLTIGHRGDPANDV